MKFMKKNQIVIYAIALMLVTAGYLNFMSSGELKTVSSSMSEEELAEMANIGDAQLVSNNGLNDVNEVEASTNEVENSVSLSVSNQNTNNITNNTLNNNIIENITTEETSSNASFKDEKNNSDYFTTSKLERDSMYSQMLETYESVLNSDNALETQKQSATEEITKINNTKNGIMIAENLIKTRGFQNCVIFVNGNSVSIIVQADDLKKEEVAQIQNIVTRELNVGVESIHISSKSI